MNFIKEFLSFKCAGDVLNSVHPILEPEKEITESMAVIKRIRKILINKPNMYSVYDLCAGNALTGSLISHLFKVKKVVAIDKEKRERIGFDKIRNFEYLNMDIIKQTDKIAEMIDNEIGPKIIVSVHPCSELAKKVIEIYNKSSDVLIMIPCCHGKIVNTYPEFIHKKLTKYELWCLDLAKQSSGKIYIENRIQSDKNIVLYAGD